MNHRNYLYGLIIVILLLYGCTSIPEAIQESSEQIPELIPREVLFGNPVKTLPKISPDAQHIAYLAPVNNVLNVWVKTIGKEDDRVVTNDTDRGIRLYFWAPDSKHIMYLQDIGGNENWRLYGIDINTLKFRDFTPFDNVQVEVIDLNKNHPDTVIIGMNKDNEQLHDVYSLNITSGELKLIAKNPGNVVSWLTDANLKVRGATSAREDGGFDLIVRENETSEWKTLLSWGYEDGLTSGPVMFSKDGKYIYLIDSRNANAGRLVKLSTENDSFEVIIGDKQYDVNDILVNYDTYEVQAVSFLRNRTDWIVLNKTIKDDFEVISKLDNGDFVVYDKDNNETIWLIGFSKDIAPVSFYAYNTKTGNATFLFYNKPDLNKYTLAKIAPISFKSRDGMTIYGYMTYPIGKERRNLSMVLVVHGGPWYRDAWGYDPEVQWLANRGYAVLQVNFRGSTGYGKDFLNAGDREWGGKMHNDLIDAAQWAIEQNVTNSDKIAIYGASYGGYAALVGATFTPDVFCCAIDAFGPSNLVTLIKSIPPYWSTFLANFHKRVGNPDTETKFLESRSPLFKVDKIKIPVLIAQGANDPRVKVNESEQIAKAMAEKDIDYEYLLFPDEGHGLAKPENRIMFYAAAEKFLAKHLGGRFEPYHGNITVYKQIS